MVAGGAGLPDLVGVCCGAAGRCAGGDAEEVGLRGGK